MCENTRKPNNLAKFKDKGVIHQKMKSVCINYKKDDKAVNFARHKNFAR